MEKEEKKIEFVSSSCSGKDQPGRNGSPFILRFAERWWKISKPINERTFGIHWGIVHLQWLFGIPFNRSFIRLIDGQVIFQGKILEEKN